MSDFPLTLVLRLKTSKIIDDMAKVIIKSERITPFGGIFPVRLQFSRFVGPVIDIVLGLRCTSYGYQYSEIVGSLSSVYFCGGDCVEEHHTAISTARLWVLCQASTSVAATVWRM